jgi:hypothetical protein
MLKLSKILCKISKKESGIEVKILFRWWNDTIRSFTDFDRCPATACPVSTLHAFLKAPKLIITLRKGKVYLRGSLYNSSPPESKQTTFVLRSFVLFGLYPHSKKAMAMMTGEKIN